MKTWAKEIGTDIREVGGPGQLCKMASYEPLLDQNPFKSIQGNSLGTDLFKLDRALTELKTASNVEAVSLGTSIMAVRYPGGVILGADSRVTTGAYIANRVSDKLTPLYQGTDSVIFCCRSGSAADTQAVADITSHYLRMTAVEQGHGPSVRQAATLISRICYENKDALMAGMIVAGVDTTGSHVFSIPLGGSLHAAPYAIGGSGSTYIYGYCDMTYREDMNGEQVEGFVTQALALAMARDGSSGGVIRLASISKDHTGEVKTERKILRGAQIPLNWRH